jgi:diguanylate cyclase (GGDEF)-like protein
MSSRLCLMQAEELIERSLISDMEEEVNMIASMKEMQNALGQLTNYTDYRENSGRIAPSAIENSVSDSFRSLKESHLAINFLFLGTEDGGYMEYPTFEPSQSYDPRLRPWYQNTVRQDQVIVSEPYKTDMTKDLVISFTKQIKKGEQVIGVAGISVKLAEITSAIKRISIGKTGYILVMSPEHKIMVSPKNEEWLLKTPVEIGIPGFEQLETADEIKFESPITGETCQVNLITSENSGLHIISVLQKDEILENARIVVGILLGIFTVTLLIIIFLLYILSKYITDPILKIASVVNHMTDYEFNPEDDDKLQSYARRGDEIGRVSNSMLKFHTNYYELMTQVNTIDEEINNLDIQQNTKLKVKVSSDNPFTHVVSSMNTLMEKIYTFFDELRLQHKELQEKNDQLVSSEEELMAQLEEIDQQKEYINFLAYHDPLTSLPNRRSFMEFLSRKVEEGSSGAVILLDIDDFKGINDTQGHVFGDKVLEGIAKRLQEMAGTGIFISRFGGDEFLLYLQCGENYPNLEQTLGEICHIFDDKLQVDQIDIVIRFSMGISLLPLDSRDVNQLVANADLAMYSVKDSGKNGFQLYDSAMMAEQRNKANIELLLIEAIEKDGFKIVYQPKVDIKTGKIHAYEALLRLKEYNVSPNIFINIAEKNGSIIKIGRIVTRMVIRQITEWRREGLEAKPVSINFSTYQLHDREYIDFLKELLEQNDVSPELIEIEITENAMLENQQTALSFLRKLKELGIGISIDDFGKGYCSLNYLTFLPIDIVKLDRSLILKFLEHENGKVIDSLISLVHSLGLTVVAEGIEMLEQVDRLKYSQCDYIQGFYFSRPLEADLIPIIHNKVYEIS